MFSFIAQVNDKVSSKRAILIDLTIFPTRRVYYVIPVAKISIIDEYTHMNNPDIKEINVRNAVMADVSFIKECLIDSWVEHAKNNPDLMTEERMRRSKVDEYYANFIQKNKGYVFIADVNGTQVGLITAYKQKLADFFKDSDILYVDDVYVLKEYRRKGIAQLLLNKIESVARENMIKRIDARVYSYNQPMQNALLTFGFNQPYSTWVKIVE